MGDRDGVGRAVLGFVKTRHGEFGFLGYGVVRELAAQLFELFESIGALSLRIHGGGDAEMCLREPAAFRVITDELFVKFLGVGVSPLLEFGGRGEEKGAAGGLGASMVGRHFEIGIG